MKFAAFVSAEKGTIMDFSIENLSIAGLISKPDSVHTRLAQYILAAEIGRENIFPPLSPDQLDHLPTDQQLIDNSHLFNNGHLEVDPEILGAIGPNLVAEFLALCLKYDISAPNTRDRISLQLAQLLTVLARR